MRGSADVQLTKRPDGDLIGKLQGGSKVGSGQVPVATKQI